MAFFKSKQKKEVKEVSVPAASVAPVRDLSSVLRHARVTEKATMHQGESVYTFNVATSATKRDIMQALRSLYKVTPRKVRIVTIPSKTTRSRKTGRVGTRGGGKKAYIYLKHGETITIG